MTDPSRPRAAGDPDTGKTAFEIHGPIRVAPGGRYLTHADGTPFFFLADTAWNGALLSTDTEWRTYLADRAAKGFTAIQFISHAPWAAARTDEAGDVAFVHSMARAYTMVHLEEKRPVRKRFFDRMEAKVAAVAEAGLLAVPVLAWAANFGNSSRYNAGVALRPAFLESIVREQVARLCGFPVLWLLAGDGKYGGLRSWKWKRIGRRVFGSNQPHAPVGLHPQGMTWPYRSFRHEKWLDVLGYQSGHSDSADTLRWHLTGPPATAWRNDPRPVINLEPCYEGIRNWGGSGGFTRVEVRRAMYASLLNAPTAGVTYGAHGVWSWENEPREPLNHEGCGVARPWHEAMQFPGSFDVQRLAAFFGSIEWWRLRPAPSLLAAQPGDADPSRFISVAATEHRDLAVVYLPRGGEVSLDIGRMKAAGEWFDPRSGERRAADISRDGRCAAPPNEDWILRLSFS